LKERGKRKFFNQQTKEKGLSGGNPPRYGREKRRKKQARGLLLGDGVLLVCDREGKKTKGFVAEERV